MIALRQITIKQGSFILDRVNLEIAQGEYAILMGQTGSGKSTLIEMICGLRRPNSGEIILNHRNVTKLKPAQRAVGYVPQDGALFQHMSVRQNLGFSLELRKASREEIHQKVNSIATQLKILYLLDRGTIALSGGERQRVALGRALIFEPDILLLDEPLSALDDNTHDELCQLIKSLTQKRCITTLHVTHSHKEAEHLGDKMYHFTNGQISEFNTQGESHEQM